MNQSFTALSAAAALLLSLSACQTRETNPVSPAPPSGSDGSYTLILSDEEITLDGQELDRDGAVTADHSILYYPEGMGITYGDGGVNDEHSQQEAEAHTVVTIHQPGTYRLSGSLSKGQIAVDLGESARTDSEAAVTLILDNAEITCTVAPALVFYRAYECDTDWISYGTRNLNARPDTAAAGARIVLADGSKNHLNGSHVAEVYQEGTSQPWYEFHGAVHSEVSLDISGQSNGSGVLRIGADRAGISSGAHLTIRSGHVNIQSQGDGIRADQDDISAVSVLGGTVQINAGLGAEGCGVNSSGGLFVEGGNLYTTSCDNAGMTSEFGAALDGGFLVSVGEDNGPVSLKSNQPWLKLEFSSPLPKGSVVELKTKEGPSLLSFPTARECSQILFSSSQLATGVPYVLTVNGAAQQHGTRAPSGEFLINDRGSVFEQVQILDS